MLFPTRARSLSTAGTRRLLCWQQRERMLPQTEIVLWTILEGPPKASQASECSELLDLTRAAYLIAAQRQPGKFHFRSLGILAAPVSAQPPTLTVAPPAQLCIKKLETSHQCAPSTATFSKRRNVGARDAGSAATSMQCAVVAERRMRARNRGAT